MRTNNDNEMKIIERVVSYNKDNILPPILILGMHNSGTSIVAEIIHKSGVFLGANMSHYESHFFSLFVNDSMILGESNRWAQLPLMSVDEVMKYHDTVGVFLKEYWFIDYVQWGYDGRSPWGFKDPRLCILLPLYLKIFPKAKVIHVQRNPEDVAASLTRRNKRGIGILNDYSHWLKLTTHYVSRAREYGHKADSYYEISYEKFCNNPFNEFLNVANFCGIPEKNIDKESLNKVHSGRIGSFSQIFKK